MRRGSRDSKRVDWVAAACALTLAGCTALAGCATQPSGAGQATDGRVASAANTRNSANTGSAAKADAPAASGGAEKSAGNDTAATTKRSKAGAAKDAKAKEPVPLARPFTTPADPYPSTYKPPTSTPTLIR